MYEEKIFDNGLNLIMEQLPFVRSIAIGVWIKSGSAFENKDNNGVAHFIEHMLFKGTQNRNAKVLAAEMDKIGGQLNAYTSKEYTCFYTVTLDEHFDEALEILHDMFANSLFDEEDIEKEKMVISEEISMCEDDPEDIAYDDFQKGVWQGSAMSLPIIGTKETVGNLNRKKILDFFNERYMPSNIVISIAGNIDFKDVTEAIKNTFGQISTINKDKRKEIECNNQRIENQLLPYTVVNLQKKKEIEQLHMLLGFKSYGIGHPLTYAAIVLSTVFGGGVSSKLFQRIREENGLTYSIYSDQTAHYGGGIFSVYAAMNPKQYKQVYALTMEIIEDFKNNLISEEELFVTKEHLKSSIVLGLETSSSRMNNIGKTFLLLGKIRTPDELIEGINRVTLEDLKQVVEEVLRIDEMSISLVGPCDDID